MSKKMKNAIFFFCLITLFLSANSQSDEDPELNTNLNNKFRDTCNPEKYTKYVEKYILDVDEGNYLSKLWDYDSKAVTDY